MNTGTSQLTLEYILLGLLRAQPRHGYALYKKVQSTPELSLIWHIKRSKLYYLLERLENEELLTVQVSSQGSYPDRKIYRLTEQGEREFQKWVHTPVQSGRHVRVEFLSKLFFVLQESHPAAVELIRAQQGTCRSWVDSLEKQLVEQEDADFISRQVFAFRIGQIEAMIDWLENCHLQLPEG